MGISGVNSKKLNYLGISVVVLAFLATLPVYANLYTVVLITSVLMYIVLTVSWAIFCGTTGYLSLATAAFFGIGIYTSAVLAGQIPIIIAVILGGLVSFCVAVLVGALTLRLRGVYFTMFTLGLVELIKHSLIWYEIKFTGTRGRFVIVVDNETIFWIMLGIFVILVIVTLVIRNSKYGLALQSIGEQEEAAAHSGINVTMLKVITFGVSAFFMGAAGAIMATRWTYIDPGIAFNLNLSFLPVLMAIFGGIGQLYGPFLGAAIIAYLEEILLTKFPYYYMLIFGVILAIVILYLPQGLSGLVDRLRRRITGEARAHT